MIKNIKKLNIIKNDHLLLNQNWKFISEKLNFFHNKNGISFYEWTDKELKNKNINGQWSGFIHNVINYPVGEYESKYKNKILPLSVLVKDFYFLDSLERCAKIFVFTEQIKNFLIENTGFFKIESLTHPAPDFLFNNCGWNNQFDKVVHVGQQLRKYHSFLELECKKEKFMFFPCNCENDILEMKKYSKKTVNFLNNVCLNEYLNILKNSIVFLDLYDVAACNTVIECVVLEVPILIKKIKGVIEYLGEDYPFYFENIAEANDKINDFNLILKTNNYMINMKKENFKICNFLKKLQKNIGEIR